jgi:RNA polymerase sigma factor (sigma-70 family)
MRQKGQDQRIADFFRKEYGRLVAYTRKLVDQAADEEPEDIVQDVMAGIFGIADVARPVENLGAYVYQSVRNRIIDLFRRRKKTVSLDAEPNGEGLSLTGILRDVRVETDTVIERRDLARRLSDAVDRLNDREKAVVLATELEGMSFAELSREWDEPVGTLLSRKSRAMAKLEKFLTLEKTGKEV